MKRVKESETNTEIAYTVKKVIRNSCDKIIKTVEKAAHKEMWNGSKRSEKKSEYCGQYRKYPCAGFYVFHFFSYKIGHNGKKRPDVKIAKPPGTEAVD